MLIQLMLTKKQILHENVSICEKTSCVLHKTTEMNNDCSYSNQHYRYFNCVVGGVVNTTKFAQLIVSTTLCLNSQ